MERTRTLAPIIAAVLLLLPVLYLGSYLALVVPAGVTRTRTTRVVNSGATAMVQTATFEHYRLGNERLAQFYWPLEQLDRRIRPDQWVIWLNDDDIEYFAPLPNP